MKIKRIAALLAVGCLMGSAVCSATVADEELTVGGISYGASVDYLRSVYGEPNKIEVEDHYGNRIDEYEYGDTLEFKIINGYVCRIDVSGNNGFATKAGVAVGMDASILKEKYGEPDRIWGDDHIYRSASDPKIGFSFEVEGGKITEIECGRLEH